MLSTFGIALTMTSTFVVQNYYFERIATRSESSLWFQEAKRRFEADPLMSEGEKLEFIQNVLRQIVASEAESKQLAAQISDFEEGRGRIPRNVALLTFPFVLLISSASAWYVVRPIQHLSAAAAQIASGNLGARAPLSEGPRIGELAVLVQDFNAMAQALEKLELERQNMIADIAHELRTPLAILQGQIDAMREGVRPLNDTSLARLDRQAQHLARLVQDLRTLSLAETGRLSLDLRVVDAARFAEGVMSSFDEKAAAKSIQLSFVSELDNVTRVIADPDRLEQIISNLVDNALRHTPGEGKVTVSVQSHGRADQVRLSILDSGPGLSEDALIHVFDRFYRAEDQIKGTTNSGLGLPIAKALVELHRGAIEVKNAAQGGAVFHVLLPVAPTGEVTALQG